MSQDRYLEASIRRHGRRFDHEDDVGAPKVAVTVGLVSGEVLLELELEPESDVVRIMDAVEAASKTPIQFQQLVHAGRVLSAFRSLQDEDIASGAHIVLVRQVPSNRSLDQAKDSLCAQYLIDCKADVNAKDENFWTPLHHFAHQSLVPACESILQSSDFKVVNAADWAGRTALHMAAAEGLLAVCECILSRPDFSAVNAEDSSGRTALHEAAAQGHSEVCAALVKRRDFTRLHHRDGWDETALQCATGMGFWMVSYAVALHCRSAALNSKIGPQGQTLLHWAISEGLCKTCLAILNRRDFDQVNAKDAGGATALHRAVEKGLTEVCLGILEREDFREVNACGEGGRTALRQAMKLDLEEVIEEIVSRGDFQGVNDDLEVHGTILHWAAAKGHDVICKALLARADFTGVNRTDRISCTALHYAVGTGMLDVCMAIVRRKDFNSLDAKDAVGKTALAVATKLRTDYYQDGCDSALGREYERICEFLEETRLHMTHLHQVRQS